MQVGAAPASPGHEFDFRVWLQVGLGGEQSPGKGAPGRGGPWPEASLAEGRFHAQPFLTRGSRFLGPFASGPRPQPCPAVTCRRLPVPGGPWAAWPGYSLSPSLCN